MSASGNYSSFLDKSEGSSFEETKKTSEALYKAFLQTTRSPAVEYTYADNALDKIICYFMMRCELGYTTEEVKQTVKAVGFNEMEFLGDKYLNLMIARELIRRTEDVKKAMVYQGKVISNATLNEFVLHKTGSMLYQGGDWIEVLSWFAFLKGSHIEGVVDDIIDTCWPRLTEKVFNENIDKIADKIGDRKKNTSLQLVKENWKGALLEYCQRTGLVITWDTKEDKTVSTLVKSFITTLSDSEGAVVSAKASNIKDSNQYAALDYISYFLSDDIDMLNILDFHDLIIPEFKRFNISGAGESPFE